VQRAGGEPGGGTVAPPQGRHRRLPLPPLSSDGGGCLCCSMLAHTRRFLFFTRVSDVASLCGCVFDPRRWR
jgi:hypothetical protein